MITDPRHAGHNGFSTKNEMDRSAGIAGTSQAFHFNPEKAKFFELAAILCVSAVKSVRSLSVILSPQSKVYGTRKLQPVVGSFTTVPGAKPVTSTNGPFGFHGLLTRPGRSVRTP